MSALFTLLGSGSSSGVPVIGCSCDVCKSNHPKNKRLRSGALIKIKKKTFLIDVGPDFRQHALRERLNHIDGVFLTHVHFDHVAGIDDLRIFNFIQKKSIDALVSKATLEDLKKRFAYLFEPLQETSSLSVQFRFQILEKDRGETHFLGVKWKYFSFFQGGAKVSGFRIGDLAYISDIKNYSQEIFPYLYDLKYLVISAVRTQSSPVHFSLEEAFCFAKKIKPKQVILTHIAHEMDHEKMQKSLPENTMLGYDGMRLEFNYEEGV